MKSVHLISAIIFTIVASGHLWRLLSGAEVNIDGWIVPMWISIFGVLGPGALAFLLWREQKISA